MAQNIEVPGYQGTQHLDRGAIEKTVESEIGKMLSGESSSMPRELVDEKKRELATGARIREEAAVERINRDAVRRGIFRSGIAARGAREAHLSTEAEISRGERQIEVEKMVADHQDKLKAIQMSETWLNNLRQYELGKERNEIAREQIRATLALGYAQIAASKENARIAASAGRAMAGLAQEKWNFEKEHYNDSLVLMPNGEYKTPAAANAMNDMAFNW